MTDGWMWNPCRTEKQSFMRGEVGSVREPLRLDRGRRGAKTGGRQRNRATRTLHVKSPDGWNNCRSKVGFLKRSLYVFLNKGLNPLLEIARVMMEQEPVQGASSLCVYWHV